MFWPFKICPIETVYVYVDAERAYLTCSELSIIRLLFVGNQLLLVAKLKRQRHILITTMSVIPSKMWRWKYSSKMPCDFLQLSFQIAHIFFCRPCSILYRLIVVLFRSTWLSLLELIYNCSSAFMLKSISKDHQRIWKLQQMVPLMVDFCVCQTRYQDYENRFNLFRCVHLKRHKRIFINIVMKRSIYCACVSICFFLSLSLSISLNLFVCRLTNVNLANNMTLTRIMCNICAFGFAHEMRISYKSSMNCRKMRWDIVTEAVYLNDILKSENFLQTTKPEWYGIIQCVLYVYVFV